MLEYDYIRNKLKQQMTEKEYKTKKNLIEEFIYHYDKMTVISAELNAESRL